MNDVPTRPAVGAPSDSVAIPFCVVLSLLNLSLKGPDVNTTGISPAVGLARFQRTLDRVRRERRQTLDEKIAAFLERIEKPATEERLDPILVRTAGRMTFPKLRDVDWIEATTTPPLPCRTRDGTALPVGRTYRDRLLQRMGDPWT